MDLLDKQSHANRTDLFCASRNWSNLLYEYFINCGAHEMKKKLLLLALFSIALLNGDEPLAEADNTDIYAIPLDSSEEDQEEDLE